MSGIIEKLHDCFVQVLASETYETKVTTLMAETLFVISESPSDAEELRALDTLLNMVRTQLEIRIVQQIGNRAI